MDPITLMMIAGGGLLGGGLFGAGKSIWGDDNDYTMEGNLNKNSEAWKQYQRFSNLDSDFYQKGDERIRRTMGDLAPKANDFMTMMGSKNFSNAQALSNIRSSQTKTNEQAGQAVLNLQMEGIKHAMTPLEMAYKNAGEDVGQKRETQSQKTNFFNEMANMGTGLLSAGVMSGMPKPDISTPSGATSNLDILGGISGKNYGSFVNPSPESSNIFSNLFGFGANTMPSLSNGVSTTNSNLPSVMSMGYKGFANDVYTNSYKTQGKREMPWLKQIYSGVTEWDLPNYDGTFSSPGNAEYSSFKRKPSFKYRKR